jgi:hypothetical protein
MTANRQNALESLLSKYAAEIKRHPRWGAAMRLQLGQLKLASGLKAEARYEFVASIRLYPYLPGAYACLLFSFLGKRLPWLYRKR